MESEDEASDVGPGEEIPLHDRATPEAQNGPSDMQERSVIRIRALALV